jgi:hypothetical protein
MRKANRLQNFLLLTCFVFLGGINSSCLGVQEKGGNLPTATVDPSYPDQGLENEEVPGEREILLKFKASVSQEEIQAFVKKHFLMFKEIIPEIDWYVFKVSGERPVAEVIKILKMEQQVEAVESQGYMDVMGNKKNEKEKQR